MKIFFYQSLIGHLNFEIVDSIENLCFYSLKLSLEVPKNQKKTNKMTQLDIQTLV